MDSTETQKPKLVLLTKQAILAADDIKMEPHDCPEWGGTVMVRALSGTDRDKYETELRREDPVTGKLTLDTYNMRVRLAALGICDEQGQRLFGDDEVAALGKKSAAPINRIAERVSQMSGISKADVEELEKNSTATAGPTSS
jgi:hypothetical protein